MVINGLQDNGSKLIKANSWYDVTGGDGMECIIDYTNSNTQYATYTNGTIYRTINEWGSDVTISDNIIGGGKGSWVTPYIIDPNNNSTLYVGYADVWKTTDKGDSFTKISVMNTSTLLRSMAIAPSNSNYLYVADQSHLWKTTDGGTNWSDITGTLPVTSNSITYLAVKHDDPLTVWVTMGGYNTMRVYQTTDGGSVWTSISAGLPSLPVMSIVQNKQATANVQLYVGTDVGVYVKNGSENWAPFSTGLPKVVVTEMEIYYDNAVSTNSKLRVATFGRGLWESDLYSSPIAPAVEFTASKTTIALGESVTFADASQNDPTSWAWTFTGATPENSTVQNPQVTYNTAGTFDVTLTATNGVGSNSLTKTAYITVNPAIIPVAGFKANNTKVYVGQEVQFTDTSANYPTEWLWSFTGGTPNSSILNNPSIVYKVAGVYDVSLTVTNSAGSNSVNKTGYIEVIDAPEYPEPLNVSASVEGSNVTLNWASPFTDTLINEGFEGNWPPQGWSVAYSSTIDGTQVTPTGATWVHCDANTFSENGAQYIHSGIYSAALGYTAPDFNWLITPEFSAEQSTKLHFWLWYYTDATYTTKFHVLVKNNGVWENLKSYGSGSTSNEYQKAVEISLNAYAGKLVQLAFVYEYNDGYQLAIDDVFVGSIVSKYQIYRNDALVTTLDSTKYQYLDAGLQPGTYNYYLKAGYTNPEMYSAASNMVEVTIKAIADANFTADVTTGPAPLMVKFTNTSTNADTYSWSFGDGSSSTEINPTHIYTEKGTYTVSLVASNSDNSDTETKVGYITATLKTVTADFVADKLTGLFPLEVTFTNNSTNATGYNWNFGDGSTSVEVSPVHIYSKAGNYTVTLEAYNDDLTDTKIKANYISVEWGTPVADFDAAPISGIDPLEVTFTDKSEYAESWAWDFGDGTTSTEQNPVHSFSKGSFSISLTIKNPTGNNSISKQNLIIVNPNDISDAAKYKLNVFPNPVSSHFNVELQNENYDQVTIKLFDSAGKLLLNVNPTIEPVINQSIDMQTYMSGNYILKIVIDNEIIVVNVVKQ